MSKTTDRLKKGYPDDQTSPKELPDRAPAEHPTPWSINEAGNGHFYIHDAKGVYIFHVFIWDGKEMSIFRRKMRRIHGMKKNASIDRLYKYP
mgnify:FL=1